MNNPQRSVFPWYLPFAAAYPALTLYASNVKETGLAAVVVAVLVLILLSIALWLLIGVATRNIGRSALPVSLAVLWFSLYKYGQLVCGLGHTAYLPLHSIAAVVTVGFAWWVDCRRSHVRTIATMAITCLAASALLQAVGAGVMTSLVQKPRGEESLERIDRRPLVGADSAKLPDVYCIILDSYANKFALREWFNFDNAEFVNGLAARGINVADVSASNFAATGNAIPTLLRMGFFDSEDNVPGYLIRKGYTFWYSRSVYPLDRSAVLADRVLGRDYGTEFWHQLVLQSMLGPSWKTFGGAYRATILNNFSHLEQASRESAPRPLFMFAHITVPHSPFVFTAAGGARYLLYTGLRTDIPSLKAAYVDQCRFANSRVLTAIDAITADERGRNAVIVLMGDHGPFYQLFSPEPGEGIGASWETAMYRNLLAIRLPNGVLQKIPSLSSANVFRWVFHAVFEEAYKPIPDRFFRDYVPGGSPEDATDVLGPQLGFPVVRDQ